MSRERQGQGVYGRPPSEQVRIEQLSESDWTSRFVRGAYRVTTPTYLECDTAASAGGDHA